MIYSLYYFMETSTYKSTIYCNRFLFINFYHRGKIEMLMLKSYICDMILMSKVFPSIMTPHYNKGVVFIVCNLYNLYFCVAFITHIQNCIKRLHLKIQHYKAHLQIFPSIVAVLQTKRHLEQMVDELNAGRPQCPVGLNTLVIPRKATLTSTEKQPVVYLNCGHVQGLHEWGHEKDSNSHTCPMCLKVNHILVQPDSIHTRLVCLSTSHFIVYVQLI